jgi:hypothetical protein
MTNRWEALIPVPAGQNLIHYRFKFDYMVNRIPTPKPDSKLSQEYTLQIDEKQ